MWCLVFRYTNTQNGFYVQKHMLSFLNPYHLWWWKGRAGALAEKDVQVHFRQQNVWPWIYNSNSLWSGNTELTQLANHNDKSCFMPEMPSKQLRECIRTFSEQHSFQFGFLFIFRFYVYFPDFNWMWKF